MRRKFAKKRGKRKHTAISTQKKGTLVNTLDVFFFIVLPIASINFINSQQIRDIKLKNL